MRFKSVLALAILLTSSSCSTGIKKVSAVYSSESRFDDEAERVLIVSFDGLRPDAIAAAGAVHIESMRQAGAHSYGARSIIPSITLPNHTSMLTGVGLEKHGIGWNDYQPELGTVNVPTVFDQAKKKGLSTALIAGKEKFLHLNRPGTLDNVEIEEGSPESVASKAISLIQAHRPQLMFVHFRHPDTEGHSNGWMSGDQLDAIAEADQGLGHILHALEDQGLLRSTTVILTADHGGSEKSHGSDSAVDSTIPWIAVGPEVPVRGALNKAITTYDTAATAAAILGLEIPSDWDGKNVLAD